MFEIRDLVVINESKAGVPIFTGIGYLDHMIDQLNSHAQIGVGLSVLFQTDEEKKDGDKKDDSSSSKKILEENRNRFANNDKIHSQAKLCSTVGENLGKELKSIIVACNKKNEKNEKVSSRFCCPLDEALVECILEFDDNSSNDGQLVDYSLAPFGKYPKSSASGGGGRKKIGFLETIAIESFWNALAKYSGLSISLTKLRGDNGHHIVESSFKAFSRALRNLLDSPTIWNKNSDNEKASINLKRKGIIQRQTKETTIHVELQLSTEKEAKENVHVETGIPVLNNFYHTLAIESGSSLTMNCNGDLYVDDHHTAEDVSIAYGQCLTQALGTKAGLNRMWIATAEFGTVKVEVTMDLSNRPCLIHNLDSILERTEYITNNENKEGTTTTPTDDGKCHLLSCEMFEHVLESLVTNGRMTVHIVVTENEEDKDGYDTLMCTAMAFGRALKVCAMVDCRRAGQTASSKGTLSV